MQLAEITSEALAAKLSAGPCAVLVPVGSVEPHGPHLPLGTDTLIGETASGRAARRLAATGVTALVAPSVPYGVTRFADGFAGAISVPAAALTPLLRAVVVGFLDAGFAHVCLVNNHLEPEHDAAVRAAISDLAPGRASIASPLTRRWARSLSAEFKSGACHAGRYETSLVLAAAPELVDQASAATLPPLTVSLSEGIRAGKASFLAMGIERAYTGAPAEATAAEGDELYERLADMVVGEVQEGLAASGAATTWEATHPTPAVTRGDPAPPGPANTKGRP